MSATAVLIPPKSKFYVTFQGADGNQQREIILAANSQDAMTPFQGFRIIEVEPVAYVRTPAEAARDEDDAAEDRDHAETVSYMRGGF